MRIITHTLTLFLLFLSLTATQAAQPQTTYRSVMVDTNNVIVAPTNFWLYQTNSTSFSNAVVTIASEVSAADPSTITNIADASAKNATNGLYPVIAGKADTNATWTLSSITDGGYLSDWALIPTNATLGATTAQIESATNLISAADRAYADDVKTAATNKLATDIALTYSTQAALASATNAANLSLFLQPLDSDLTVIAGLTGVNGDILIYNSGWARLAKGTDGQILKLASGLPSWGTDLSGSSGVTMSGAYDYISLSGQDIVRGQIDLGTDVTGTLADSSIPSTIARDAEVSSSISALSSVYQPLDADLSEWAGVGTNTFYGWATAYADAQRVAATNAANLSLFLQPLDADLTALASGTLNRNLTITGDVEINGSLVINTTNAITTVSNLVATGYITGTIGTTNLVGVVPLASLGTNSPGGSGQALLTDGDGATYWGTVSTSGGEPATWTLATKTLSVPTAVSASWTLATKTLTINY